MKGAIADQEPGSSRSRDRGMTLLECVFALSMIAFSLPVLMLVVGQSRSAANQMALHGQAGCSILQHSEELSRKDFPEPEKRIIWAHGNAGECLGRLKEADYQRGLRHLDGRALRYLVVASLGDGDRPNPSLLLLALEYPAAAPLGRRHRMEFHTRLAP